MIERGIPIGCMIHPTKVSNTLNKKFIFLLILTVHYFSFSSVVAANEVNPSQWKFEHKRKIVAIADIHADPQALLSILVDRKILDKKGKFISNNIDIVFTGDFAAKGSDTRGVWDIINYVETEAIKSNSNVHTLLGNHDTVILMGNTKRMQADDLKRFKFYDKDPIIGLKKALISEPYKKMMAKWKAVVKLGDIVFYPCRTWGVGLKHEARRRK